MDWYSLRPSSSISVCYFTLANPAHYAVIFPCSCSAFVCSCFFLSYIQDSHRRVTPVHVFIFLLFILCLYTLELTLAYVDETGWFLSVQFLSPCLELSMYICVMVKSCCLTS